MKKPCRPLAPCTALLTSGDETTASEKEPPHLSAKTDTVRPSVVVSSKPIWSRIKTPAKENDTKRKESEGEREGGRERAIEREKIHIVETEKDRLAKRPREAGAFIEDR